MIDIKTVNHDVVVCPEGDISLEHDTNTIFYVILYNGLLSSHKDWLDFNYDYYFTDVYLSIGQIQNYEFNPLLMRIKHYLNSRAEVLEVLELTMTNNMGLTNIYFRVKVPNLMNHGYNIVDYTVGINE